ncbi:peptidoglycan DD-metalloendopeptidase family protein [Limosilactobacillus reuteri subsp. suis]|uniref:Peptidase M23 n=1 Tax=Limosilactobacillus reuteri TaxID=1598 RepID=A0A1V4FKG8_LIMRT|nr:M23 family metallopeptidase [Limosilactobacillus reuteri]OJI11047.1 peptidase M23 [Limosilactobacillus reuteri]OPG88109.1 peptidase M23 [Limosilactobacillus reuteri]
MEDKLIFKPSHLKSKVLSTLTVCGGALFLLSGNAAADDQTTDVQQPVTPQQTTNEQPNTSTVDVQTPNTYNGVAVSPQASETTQNTENYNVVPTQDNNQEVQHKEATQPQNPNNYGYLDSVSLSNNELQVSGWQATNQAADKPYHYVIAYDNTVNAELGRQQVENVSRPDVAQAYPDATNADNSGFNSTIKLNTTNEDYTNHSISVISRYSDATNGEGNHVDYWYPAFAFDQGNYAWLDDMHTENDQLQVSGWNATNQANNKDYHYVILYDTTKGRELSRQLVDETASQRPDVQKAYSNVNNAGKSGFNVTFDLSKLSFDASDQLQVISRYSNAENGEGDRVDYWFAPTSRENQGYLDSANFSNGQLVVNGWHANDASTIAPNHFLILFDQTAKKQAGVINATQIDRTDVANAFKNIQTANQSGFSGTFNADTIIPGHEYSLVSRYSTSANGNGDTGHYVDYWFNDLKFDQARYSIDSFTQNDNNGFHVTGWMVSDFAINRPNAYVILLNNGKEVTRSKVTLTDRSDVAAVYPSIYNSRKSGFSTDLNVDPTSLNGELSFVLRFTSSEDGNSNYSDQYTSKYATNTGYFDTVDVTDNQIKVAGWHASTQANGKDYQFIIVLDQSGHELARQAVNTKNITRDDVQKVYPWLENSDKSGFETVVNLNDQINHKAVRLIHRFSNQANGEGNYVDYYSDLVSVHSEFQNENGSTYYYDPRTGAKQTGWANINNNNYYFDPSTGAMFTGTHTVDGKSYDFGSNGVAVENDKWGWPFPSTGEGHFSGAQLFGVNAGGQFRMNGFHDGLDFGSIDHPGAEVHAIHGGKVTQIGYTAGLDWYVLVDTGEYLTVYQEAFSNRNNIQVQVGQQINVGDVIGRRDTSHLHIGVTRQHNFNIALANSFNNNGTWLNPLDLIRNGSK